MSKAEDFILEHTSNCFNYNGYAQTPEPWITPDDAREAIKIAREELIDKAIGQIVEIYNCHDIMQYSDSCEPTLDELTEWFKNDMKEENINSK